MVLASSLCQGACVEPTMGKESGKVVVLDFWASPYAMRTKIALREKGVEFEVQEEDLWNKSELLLKSNPVHEKVPVLIHNNTPISESLVQVQYIDETWTEGASFLPTDPQSRATARFWADFADKTISFDGGRKIWGNKIGEEQDKGIKEFLESLKALENELGDKSYFGGETFSYVDIALVPFYSWFYALEECGHFSVEAACPKIVAWGKRCVERKSVADSLPESEKVYQQVLKLRQIFGVEECSKH
ncbi:PREDICTED: glutathione S-transferase U28 [Camelina sativa]|uniref:glutathione transferase n=1 Tax=Camelina sativa TaxID=90675 RepID=A0ABM0YHP4_CAMSA|nr:PREDICTED: glutathione S-transferase U28 [Camelina sativa]